MSLLYLLMCCGAVSAELPQVQPEMTELAPAPHAPYPPVAIVAIKNGYQVYLNRATAELFRDALENADPKELAAMLRQKARERKEKDPEDQTIATLEMAAFVTATQLPGFKKSLAKNIGQNGAVITLTGLQTPVVQFKKPRPILQKAAGVVRDVMPLLPGEAKEVIEGLRAVGRTKPLIWKVESRE